MEKGQPRQVVVSISGGPWAGGGSDIPARLRVMKWPRVDREQCDSLILDLSGVESLEPWAVALFAAYGLRAVSQGDAVDVRPAANETSNECLERSGLAEVLRTGKSAVAPDPRGQNTRLHVLREFADVKRFFRAAAGVGSGSADVMLYSSAGIMSELGRNVIEHSGASGGGAAIAQYLPDRGVIQFAIADAGRGIASTLRANHPQIRSDIEALKLALLPHISCTEAPGDFAVRSNAGLGLFFCKETACRAGGSFWIASGAAVLGIRPENSPARRRAYETIEPWQGTLVVMDFPAEEILKFDALLKTCTNVEREARRILKLETLLHIDATLERDARRTAKGPDLNFLGSMPETGNQTIIHVREFSEDSARAGQVREQRIRPIIAAGDRAVLDFGGVEFATQSFVYVLLDDVLRMPGARGGISFVGCTPPTRAAIAAVAAHASLDLPLV